MAVRNLVVVLLAAAISLPCHAIAAKQHFANVFASALTMIHDHALKEVPDRDLFDSAMRGMLDSVDKNAAYLSGAEFTAMEERMRQEFGGVGMHVDVNPADGVLTITYPMPQAPAFAAGLRSGDLILQIDGEPTAGLDRISAIQRLRGPVGQELHLTIRRPPSLNEFEVKIRRGLIPAPSVVGDSLQPDGSWEYWLPEDPRIAYLQIIEFLDKTDVELADALAQVRPKAQALILDLRSNGGGLLTQAVRVADMFLPPGCLIVETRGRQRRMVQPSSITYSSDPWDDDRPLVVLVDQETASASEIVAACWQDHHRAIIVGEQTFGKGTIQDSIPLEPGRSSMRFTTATFWRPSGLNIDRGSANGSDDWGVRPDIGFEVKLSEDERRQVDGLRYRRQYKLFNIFESTAAPAPLPQDSATPPAPRLTEDPVLQRAIDHLRQTLDRTVST